SRLPWLAGARARRDQVLREHRVRHLIALDKALAAPMVPACIFDSILSDHSGVHARSEGAPSMLPALGSSVEVRACSRVEGGPHGTQIEETGLNRSRRRRARRAGAGRRQSLEPAA